MTVKKTVKRTKPTNEDRMTTSEVFWFKAQSIRQLVDAGYDKTSVKNAVGTGDLSLLIAVGK